MVYWNPYTDLVATQSQLRPIATEYQLENQALVRLTPDTFRDISYPNQSGDVLRHDWEPQAAWLLGFDYSPVARQHTGREPRIDGRVKAPDAVKHWGCGLTSGLAKNSYFRRGCTPSSDQQWRAGTTTRRVLSRQGKQEPEQKNQQSKTARNFFDSQSLSRQTFFAYQSNIGV